MRYYRASGIGHWALGIGHWAILTTRSNRYINNNEKPVYFRF
ncbi:hypothetical protein QUB13_21280 [Microcoleus sp. B4-D4]